MPTLPTGLLIIRAWVEEGSPEPLRAQIRVSDDIAKGIEHTITLTQAGQVDDLVNAWIRHIVAAAAPDAA